MHLSLFLISASNKTDFSFNPEKADLISNAVLMEQLVGTLVKDRHGNTGSSEPYLAESWSTSNDQLIWTFKLRKNLQDESGQEIDARSFAKSLTNRLLHLVKVHDVPVFNQLLGWQEFAAGKSHVIKGLIESDNRSVSFHFSSPPEGLLQYLAMPAFGFYSEANFSSGKWRNERKIFSSGPYKVKSIEEDGKIVLTKRERFLPEKKEAPELIEIKNITQESLKDIHPTRAICLLSKEGGLSRPTNGFVNVPGAPIFLTAIVLSPTIKRLFHTLENRKKFSAHLRHLISKKRAQAPGAFFNFDFYPVDDSKIEVPHVKSEKMIYSGKEPILINIGRRALSIDGQVILGAIEEVLRENSIPFQIVQSDIANNDWLAKVRSNDFYDIRFASVDVGGNLEKWVLKMMFCSKLGISFPDPSGRICRLVEDKNISGMEMASSFRQILRDDESVVPLYHYGQNWLFSEDLNLDDLSSSLVVPRLELIRAK